LSGPARWARGVTALLGRRPWPAALGLTLGGWLMLPVLMHGLMLPAICTPGWDPARGLDAAFTVNAPGHLLAAGLAMLLAMLPPMVALPLMRLWDNALRRNRRALVAAFLLGYGGVWLLAGMAAMAVTGLLGQTAAPALIALALPMLWHLSPGRQRVLNACHRRPPIRAFGPAAVADALRHGLRSGALCAAACLPLMLVSARLGEAHLAAMALACLWLAIERQLPPRPPRWVLPRRPGPRRDMAPA
jgi:predicted metal-binding membrane protein